VKIKYDGQIVLITGATRGIGKRIAEDIAGLGASLILTGTNPDQVKTLNNTYADKRKYYCVDFSDEDSTGSFIEELKNYEKIDVCINNAGINRINFIDETLIEDWENIIDVNLKAPFTIIREISKNMKKNNYGRIVNISSIFGVISREKRSIYSASKFGLRGLTVAASNELAKYNILVNTVSPGFVLTELTRSMLSQEEMNELAEQVPAKRLAHPDEISRVVLFIASSLNTYITGQNIVVDGGYTNV